MVTMVELVAIKLQYTAHLFHVYDQLVCIEVF